MIIMILWDQCIAPPIPNIPKLKGSPAKFPDKMEKTHVQVVYLQLKLVENNRALSQHDIIDNLRGL